LARASAELYRTKQQMVLQVLKIKGIAGNSMVVFIYEFFLVQRY
jgi:hypothetical protein